MKYSYNGLRHFISLDLSSKEKAKEYANLLTLSTCEIEGTEQRILPELLVIGYVKKVISHPNADKLVICTIDCGDRGEYQIITGGTNVQENTYVPVALPGCHLPAIQLDISERKMRGELSQGMICAKEEIGIMENTDKHWIWTLDEDFDDLETQDIGKSLKSKYPRLENTIWDVDNKTITNRPDLTGYWGLAVEVQTLLRKQPESITFSRVKQYIDSYAQRQNTKEHYKELPQSKRTIQIQSEKVRSYSTLELQQVQVKPSNFYTRTLLRDMQIIPKNNRVDIGNLFMHTTGQPVHCFDADKITGDIQVRQAKKGETMLDLMGKTHTLLPQDIVIADEEKILAIAGVIGGQSSAVQEDTTNILVEIANFDPVHVRKTAMRIGQRTDASMRFEKDINPRYTQQLLQTFLNILKQYKKDLQTYTMHAYTHWVQDSYMHTQKIEVSMRKMQMAIRGAYEDKRNEAISEILKSLGFSIQAHQKDSDNISIYVPSRRGTQDCTIAADIYEEVIRIYGYEHIPSVPLSQTAQHQEHPKDVAIHRKWERLMTEQLHYTQLPTYPRSEDKHIQSFRTGESDTLLSLRNPVRPETAQLRDSILYNIRDHITKNHRFYETIAIYDIGSVWNSPYPGSDQTLYGVQRPQDIDEQWQLGAMLFQQTQATNRKESLFLQAKQHMCHLLDIKPYQTHTQEQENNDKRERKETDYTCFHPSKQAQLLYKNTPVGRIVQIHPLVAKTYKLPQTAEIIYRELSMDQVMHIQAHAERESKHHFHTLQDQIVTRDLCFVIPRTESFQSVVQAIHEVENIIDVHTFDLYQGENLSTTSKSIACTLYIQGDGSMKTQDINAVMDAAIVAAEQTGAQLRE